MSAWIEANWPAPPGVRAITTTRHGLGRSKPPFDAFNLGIRNGDEIDAAMANRAALSEALRLPSAPRWLKQVHGTTVVHFDDAAASHDVEPEADAAVTSSPDVVLAILTADCLPVVFAAKKGHEIAAAHAGWRGLAAGVLEATVQAMRTPSDRLIAWLGPAAGPDAYEIGEEVRDAFVAHDTHAASAFAATRPDHWRVDLFALARQRLHALGMADADIHGGNRCTISEPEHFFSHRRDGRSGRIATLAWIE